MCIYIPSSRPGSLVAVGMQVVGLQATDFALLFWLEVDQPQLSRSSKDAISQVLPSAYALPEAQVVNEPLC